jgi:hypothetical protein
MATKILHSDPTLAEHAAEIRGLGKRVVGDVIEIGRRLTECKRICGHGNWLPCGIIKQKVAAASETKKSDAQVAQPPASDDGLDIPAWLRRAAP